jgi:hypothetical protein
METLLSNPAKSAGPRTLRPTTMIILSQWMFAGFASNITDNYTARNSSPVIWYHRMYNNLALDYHEADV